VLGDELLEPAAHHGGPTLQRLDAEDVAKQGDEARRQDVVDLPELLLVNLRVLAPQQLGERAQVGIRHGLALLEPLEDRVLRQQPAHRLLHPLAVGGDRHVPAVGPDGHTLMNRCDVRQVEREHRLRALLAEAHEGGQPRDQVVEARIVHRVPPRGPENRLNQISLSCHQVHSQRKLRHLLDDAVSQGLQRLTVALK